MRQSESVVLRQKSLVAHLRQSVLSWNLEFDKTDILSSVLAVMDNLKREQPIYEQVNQPVTTQTHPVIIKSEIKNRVDNDPIYAEVPCFPETYQVEFCDTPDESDDSTTLLTQSHYSNMHFRNYLSITSDIQYECFE